MLLEGDQVVEGIDAPQIAGVDQAHEHIADEGAMLGPVEERVFSVEDGLRNDACVRRLSDKPDIPASSYRSMYRRNVRSHTPKIRAASS